MKRKSRSSRQKLPEATEIPAGENLSSMESIANIENEIVYDDNLERLEATERDYNGRSTQEEDGAVPMIPPDQNPISSNSPRKPLAPPKHNI